jgi:hypothetical protein
MSIKPSQGSPRSPIKSQHKYEHPQRSSSKLDPRVEKLVTDRLSKQRPPADLAEQGPGFEAPD